MIALAMMIYIYIYIYIYLSKGPKALFSRVVGTSRRWPQLHVVPERRNGSVLSLKCSEMHSSSEDTERKIKQISFFSLFVFLNSIFFIFFLCQEIKKAWFSTFMYCILFNKQDGKTVTKGKNYHLFLESEFG